MYLITKLSDGTQVECEVDDYEVHCFAGSNRTDMPTRRRQARSWTHKRGWSAMSHSRVIALMMLEEMHAPREGASHG